MGQACGGCFEGAAKGSSKAAPAVSTQPKAVPAASAVQLSSASAPDVVSKAAEDMPCQDRSAELRGRLRKILGEKQRSGRLRQELCRSAGQGGGQPTGSATSDAALPKSAARQAKVSEPLKKGFLLPQSPEEIRLREERRAKEAADKAAAKEAERLAAEAAARKAEEERLAREREKQEREAQRQREIEAAAAAKAAAKREEERLAEEARLAREAAEATEAARVEAELREARAAATVGLEQWQAGQQGVVDISAAQNGSLLVKEAPDAPKDAKSPADGTHVTLDCEVVLLGVERGEAPGVIMPYVQLVGLQLGSGLAVMPEELELALPHLRLGVATEVLVPSFGSLGPDPDGHRLLGAGLVAPAAWRDTWKNLAGHDSHRLLFKLKVVQMEELCMATLEAPERFAWAKGRKEAGGNFFARGRIEAALERYSIAAEMLDFKEDLNKEGSLLFEARELCTTCELNAAMCLLRLKKWGAAEGVCSAVLRNHPSNEKALFRRAKARLEQLEIGRAQMDLKMLLEINPDNAEAKQLLAKSKRDDQQNNAREKAVAQKMLLRGKKSKGGGTAKPADP